MVHKHAYMKSSALLGFLFLYAPMVLLVMYSFNGSKLTSIWGGFSLKWYPALLQNEEIVGAALVSVKIAVISATLAVILGTLAAFCLSRFGRFRARLALSGMVTAPLVMPDVITGLSLLLLFVAMEGLFGWPAGRSITTIIIAHTTFCMASVTVIVQSRLESLDVSLEEAAMDLGAPPSSMFALVTLPLILPALVSGWLLSFTLSFDDLVIASFVSGPGDKTLPMVIYSKVRMGMTPEINALATLMIAVVTLGVLGAAWQMRRQARRSAAAATS